MQITYDSLSDRQIIEKIALKDEDAFRTLLDRYEYKVYSFSRKLIKEKQVAEEITQDIFIQIWQNADKIIDVESLSGWLFRSTKNKSINMLRQQLARFERETHYANAQDKHVHPDQAEQHSQQQQLLENFLTLLPDKARRVFELKIQEGLSNDEIARRLNISAHTVKNHLTFCYQKLKMHASHSIVLMLLHQIELNDLLILT